MVDERFGTVMSNSYKSPPVIHLHERPVALPNFDPSRVHVLPRGENVLVMDRLTGRWVMFSGELHSKLLLLGVQDRTDLPDVLRAELREISAILMEKKIGTGEPRRFNTLNTLIIKLTKACNLACQYCYDYEIGDKAVRIEREVSLSAARQAVDLCEGRLLIILHGGEPMLAWRLIEEIVTNTEAYAAQRNVKVQFVGQTNMTRLDDRIVQFSLEHNLAWGVSLDGFRETHDLFRVTQSGEGSFKLFLAALNRYPEFVRRCSVMTTVTCANDHALLEICRYFRDLGMAAWDWSLFQPIGRGRDTARFNYRLDHLLGSWEELLDAVLNREFDEFPVKPVLKFVNNFINGVGSNMCMRPQCGAARDLLSVSYDGTIEACDSLDRKGPLANLGHVLTHGLAVARASPRAELVRSRDVRKLQCGSCIWYGVCGGTCMAHAGGLNQIWEDSCALSMLAFDRISASLADSDLLLRYQARFLEIE
jgi:uncharacterized protein